MRTTIFEYRDGDVEAAPVEHPDWNPLDEYDGKALERVRDFDVLAVPQAAIQLVEIGAGGSFAMHSSPDVAFCQIVRKGARLRRPRALRLPARNAS